MRNNESRMNEEMDVKSDEVLDRLAVAAVQKTKEKEYWLNRLSGKLEKTVFPSDRKKTGNLKGQRALAPERVKFHFTGEAFQRLMALSSGSDNRLFMIMVGTLVTLLLKYTRNNDVIVGTTILKQELSIDETKLINTVLPLRIQPDDNMTFKELLLEVRQAFTEANEHQNYPYEILLKHLDLKNSEDGSPLFDIGIFVENIQDKRYFRGVKPDLIFSFLRTENGGEGELEYNSLLYETQTIKRLLTHFTVLLEEAVFNIDSKLSELSILSYEEKRRILHEFNNTKKDIRRDKCYYQLFEEQVAGVPGEIAAIDGSGQLTYDELNKEVNPIASFLIEKGVKANDIVGIYMKRGLKMLASIIGIFKAGGAYLALDVDYPEERILNILEDSEVRILIAEKENISLIDGIKERLPFLQTTLCLDHHEKTGDTLNRDPGDPGINPAGTVSTDSLAYIIYTSGTTGKPKGVMIHQLGMLNHIYANVDFLSITSSDVIAQTASPCFDISVWQFLTAPLLGGRTFIIDKEQIVDPLQLLDILQKGKITILEAVPSLMGALLAVLEQWGHKELEHLRWMIPTGEALSVSLARDWYNYFPGIKLVNAYGPAEASDDVTLWVVEPDALDGRGTIPIGKPLQNLHVYIMDSRLALCPVKIVGEICIAGLGVGKGYLKDPEKTTKSFVPNPYIEEIGDEDYSILYRTGDIGYFTEDGNIEFLGRKDHQVKVRGFRIELEEIENQLLDAGRIKEAVVVAKDGRDEGEKYLCAYVVPDPLSSLSVSALREHLSLNLPYYMVPSYFVLLDKIPLTPNGKIDRKALPDPEMQMEDDHIAPRDKLEEALAELWSEVLNIKKSVISIDSNFFESGGHSLKATILVTKIHKKLNVNVSIIEVFKTPTIRGLAKYINSTAENKFESITAMEVREYYDVTHSQKRLWVLSQVREASLTFNLRSAYYIVGKLNKKAFNKVFETLVERHESLRTVFITVEEELKQKILSSKETGFFLEHIDLRGIENNELKAREWIHNDVNVCFDLMNGPLLRVKLMQLEDEKCFFLFTIHHIISDQASTEVLVNEMLLLYNLYREGKGNALEPLRIHYKDYAAWQNERLKGEKMEMLKSYWLNQLQGELPVLAFPTDMMRPKIKGHNGDVESFYIDEELTPQLRYLCKRNDVTLFMTLLTAVKVLLYRYTGQTDIIVGAIMAGREHADLEGQIGFYINTLALRTRFSPEETFESILKKVKMVSLGAYENQVYPFDELVENLGIKRDLSRHPIFDVVVNMMRIDMPENNFPKNSLQIIPYNSKFTKSKFDLTFYVFEREQSLRINLEYNVDLFKKETMSRLCKRFQILLKHIVRNPVGNISEFPIEEKLEFSAIRSIDRARSPL